MSRYNACLGSLLLMLVACSAPTAPQPAPHNEEDIRALEQQQVSAALAGNREQLEQIFAAQFRVINPSGAVASREELLALLLGSNRPYSAATYSTDSVADYGNVVVTTGTEQVEYGSGAQAGQHQGRRVTQVWERTDAGWRLALRQATLIAPPPP